MMAGEHGTRQRSEPLEKFFGRYTSSRVDGQFHLTDLFVYLFHEVDDEVNQFVFIHLFCVEVRD